MSAEEIRYEKTDARATPIVRYAIGLLVGTGITAGVCLGVLHAFREMDKKEDPAPPAMAIQDAARLPPQPRLQVHPTLDAAEMRRQADEDLKNYGWVDQSKGTVHIPIERAMELLVERGVPTRAQAAPAAAPAPAVSPSPDAAMVESQKPGYRPGEPSSPRPVEEHH